MNYPQTLIDAKERHTRAKEAYFSHRSDDTIESDIQGDILNREMCAAYEVYHAALDKYRRQVAAVHDKNTKRHEDAAEPAKESAHG